MQADFNACTHLVVGVPDDDSSLLKAALLGVFKPGMDQIAWCQNFHDAGVVRRAFEDIDADREFFIFARPRIVN